MTGASQLSYWVETTASLVGISGIQRVTRQLAVGLEANGCTLDYLVWSEASAAPIRCPPHLRRKLARWNGPRPESLWRAALRRLRARGLEPPIGRWFVVPELTYHRIDDDGAKLRPDLAPALIAHAHRNGGRIAFVFHDLIPVTLPGYEHLRAAHESYLRHIAHADLIIAVSEHSALGLSRYFSRIGIAPLPTIRAIPLAHEFAGRRRVKSIAENAANPLRIACIGSIEPRKNHALMVRAFDAICRREPALDARLCLIGHVFPECREEITALARGNPGIEISGDLPDEEMIARLQESHFTVFPSLEEGFGMPIAESLWFGKPCLCANFGAMAELAAGGGCLAVDFRSQDQVERALAALVFDRDLRRRLSAAASARKLTTWRDYAQRVASALATAGARN